MKRTTVYLEPDLEVLLKLEMLKQGRPMAEIVREAVQAYVTREPQRTPPGAGSFASGRSETASRVDDVLVETGFGEGAHRRPRQSRTASGQKRR